MRRRQDETAVDPRIPYDQTDPMVDVPAPAPTGGDPALEGAQAQAQAPLLSQLGGQDQGMTTDNLTGAQLGQLVGGDQLPPEMGSPEDVQAADLEARLSDPNTPPEERAQIEALIALAARRALAGGGGAPA